MYVYQVERACDLLPAGDAGFCPGLLAAPASATLPAPQGAVPDTYLNLTFFVGRSSSLPVGEGALSMFRRSCLYTC
jgi:hypothetical protein